MNSRFTKHALILININLLKYILLHYAYTNIHTCIIYMHNIIVNMQI